MSVTLVYERAERIPLSVGGFDERWLQDRIEEDPSILGLGDLKVLDRERIQAAGGRIDFLMKDPETDMMFEIEIQLGRTDESHIIRTIEYWDNERARWATRDHRAVIVAEEITNRFFNVISLLSRSIPIIAIQLNALRLGDRLVLDFTKVLDVYEPPEEEEELDEPADRAYWERRSNAVSLRVVDECAALLEKDGQQPTVTYKKSRITLSAARRDFVQFYPRATKEYCRVHLWAADRGAAQALADKLEESGISSSLNRTGSRVRISVGPRELRENSAVIRDVLKASDGATSIQSPD